MNREIIEGSGFTVREAIAHIERCREMKEKDDGFDIQVPGFSYDGCDYNKIMKEEAQPQS